MAKKTAKKRVLTKSIAKELGSRNITVNSIAPGYIETEMTEKLAGNIKENLFQIQKMKGVS